MSADNKELMYSPWCRKAQLALDQLRHNLAVELDAFHFRYRDIDNCTPRVAARIELKHAMHRVLDNEEGVYLDLD